MNLHAHRITFAFTLSGQTPDTHEAGLQRLNFLIAQSSAGGQSPHGGYLLLPDAEHFPSAEAALHNQQACPGQGGRALLESECAAMWETLMRASASSAPRPALLPGGSGAPRTLTARVTVVYDPERASPFYANSSVTMSGLDDMATYLQHLLADSLSGAAQITLYASAAHACADERGGQGAYRRV